MCFPGGGTHNTRNMCFPGVEHITQALYVSQVGELKSLVICVFQVGEDITLGMCVSQVGGTQITRDMCFPGRGTHICFQVGKHITLGICVSQVGEHRTLGMLLFTAP